MLKLYKETFDSFEKFFDAYTKKENSEHDEKKAFEELCKAMEKENERRLALNKRNYEKIAKKRKENPNYGRPKREHVKR